MPDAWPVAGDEYNERKAGMSDMQASTSGGIVLKKCRVFGSQSGERSEIFLVPFSSIKVKKIAIVETGLYQFSRDDFFQEHTPSLLDRYFIK